MKKFNLLILPLALWFFISSCDDDHGRPGFNETKTLRVTIENVMEPKEFFSSGTFLIPEGDAVPGPATPGKQFRFSFYAPKGSSLSFATMFGQSNDLFYAPGGEGIALYDGDNGISGDITGYVRLWDAGTEVNEEPGVGSNQAPRQSAPNTGATENEAVREISMVTDGYDYPAVGDVLEVTLDYKGGSMFEVVLKNVSTATTIMSSMGGMPAPHSPGVWVVHTEHNPLFIAGETILGNGLEGIAEDGNPSMLGTYLEGMSGYVSPISPGVWAITRPNTKVFFTEGEQDRGAGLEQLAEEGNPEPLKASLAGNMRVISSGIYNTPVGGSTPGPIFPGQRYEFEIRLRAIDMFSFASMLGNSNDFFFAFDDTGISLKNEERASTYDLSNRVYLWDAGTEVDEYPGAGPNQAPRQPEPDSGADENGAVSKVIGEDDGFMWPDASQAIRVTVTPVE